MTRRLRSPERKNHVFTDRLEAGHQLADRLMSLRGNPNLVVVGLPRGGVPVAAVVAEALYAPLDVIVVRKLGLPSQPEVAMGALGEGDVMVLNDELIRAARVTEEQLSVVQRGEGEELKRRAVLFRENRDRISLAGRTVLIVDDGIATGSTAQAACHVARAEGAERVILAVPVAPDGWIQRLAEAADEFVSLATPPDFVAVGQFYRRFDQTSDREVVTRLTDAAARMAGRYPAATAATVPHPRKVDVEIAVGTFVVEGHLRVPSACQGIVVFVHGSGSSRHSPRNQYVASVLNESGMATLLFDLLTQAESHDRANVFDIELLAGRLLAVTRWVRAQPDLAVVPLAYFGASTGAAAALWAAAEPDIGVAAVVSRGGRPDLAGPQLGAVRAPTLLIVGQLDHTVVDLNAHARAQLQCENELRIVPGATHLFEEPGTLQMAADLAAAWFVDHLVPVTPQAR